MFVKIVVLQNFRNFQDSRFIFEPGMNCVIGPNGSGKSNLLESIFFAATGRPSRAGRDGELVKFGESVGRVEVHVQKRISEHILETALERVEGFSARKIMKLNHYPVRKLSELLGQVKVVLFTPGDQDIVQGEPSCRRRFLDLALSQVSSDYLRYLQQYHSVKEQRNALLRRPHAESDLSPWNTQLIDSGTQVLTKRLEILPRLSLLTSEAYRRFSPDSQLSFSYFTTIPVQPSVSQGKTMSEIRISFSSSFSGQDLAGSFEKALKCTAFEESQRGMTLVGPHRDDFGVFLDEKDARLFGSYGQQKMIVLALRLAEGGLFEEVDGEPPVYLLDDCFSELDPLHQSAVSSVFLQDAQVIISTATPLNSFSSAQIISLPEAAQGKVEVSL